MLKAKPEDLKMDSYVSWNASGGVARGKIVDIRTDGEVNSSIGGYTLTGSIDSTVRDFATGSDFYTYATTIGLYNDENELLAVAKFGKPIMMSPDTDMTFVVKYDD